MTYLIIIIVILILLYLVYTYSQQASSQLQLALVRYFNQYNIPMNDQQSLLQIFVPNDFQSQVFAVSNLEYLQYIDNLGHEMLQNILCNREVFEQLQQQYVKFRLLILRHQQLQQLENVVTMTQPIFQQQRLSTSKQPLKQQHRYQRQIQRRQNWEQEQQQLQEQIMQLNDLVQAFDIPIAQDEDQQLLDIIFVIYNQDFEELPADIQQFIDSQQKPTSVGMLDNIVTKAKTKNDKQNVHQSATVKSTKNIYNKNCGSINLNYKNSGDIKAFIESQKSAEITDQMINTVKRIIDAIFVADKRIQVFDESESDILWKTFKKLESKSDATLNTYFVKQLYDIGIDNKSNNLTVCVNGRVSRIIDVLQLCQDEKIIPEYVILEQSRDKLQQIQQEVLQNHPNQSEEEQKHIISEQFLEFVNTTFLDKELISTLKRNEFMTWVDFI